MNIKYLILSMSILLLQNCSTDDDISSLPPITQTGENTFGCFIDGKLLIPRDGSGTFNNPDRGMILWGSPPGLSYNEIDVRDFKSGSGGLINIHITKLEENGVGSYTINESNCQDNVDANPNVNLFCRWWDKATQTFKWYCSIENTGTLTILRYDSENRIVSGTFSCRAINQDDATEIIEITQGRFDINWDTLLGKEFP